MARRMKVVVGEYIKTRKKIIEVDGQQYEAKYLGKGQYSKVYQVGDRVIMYTRGDCAKEVLAMFQYDRMAHLPELISHEKVILRNRDYDWWVFSSPFYRNVTTKDRSAWLLMKKIMLWWSEWNDRDLNKYRGIHGMQEFVNFSYDDFPKSVIRALEEIVNIASNCGDDIGFDFQKSNFGVNEYGTLIFRDVIWVRS